MMGLGHMGYGYSAFMEQPERGVVSVEKVQSAGIGVRLDVPPLRLAETSVLTIWVFDAESGVPVSDALVSISVRKETASPAPGSSILDAGSNTLVPVRSSESGSYQFLLTPRQAGRYAIEATVYYPQYSKDETVSLGMAREVSDTRVSGRRRSWISSVAIIGGISMMAIMVLFMGGGHGHGS